MPTWNTSGKALTFTCPTCQRKFSRVISLTQSQQYVICPACHTRILLKSESGKSIKDQTDAAIKDALKKAGFK